MEPKRFLITGGSQGIGAALVGLARREGHTVVFTGRHEETIAPVASETGAVGVTADSRVEADNARVIEICQRQMSGIDVLVNNAASWYDAAIGELDMDAMRRLFDSNVFGMVDLTNRVVPLMKAQQRGDIVNLSSTSGTKGRKLGTAYAASKWAVRGITQCWQAELRPHSIRVVSICPSEVQTRWGGRDGRDNPNKLYAVDVAQTIMAALAMHPRAFWPELSVFATNPWKEES
jgi:3-oxoacyl-[acyl-carrier protein] reductase|tara:strand:- start:1055 stop:1753 length:699 start_codon:yes stop_codon:yes gene_type:complete